MYNDQPGIPTVLAIPVLAGGNNDLGTRCVPIGAGEIAVVDYIEPTAKAMFERWVRDVPDQRLADPGDTLDTWTRFRQ